MALSSGVLRFHAHVLQLMRPRAGIGAAALQLCCAIMSSGPPGADVPMPGESPANCKRCDLWKHATQAVVGEGPRRAPIMLVGEQPGDEEDLRGHPFVGPAGRLLDTALEEAGLDRNAVFITNAVKHFKWEPRGKRRLHKKPNVREIRACNVWLEQEIVEIRPAVIIALGGTALRALTGASVTIAAARGNAPRGDTRRADCRHSGGAPILASYHPSAILRAEGEHARELRDALIQDLRRARALAGV